MPMRKLGVAPKGYKKLTEIYSLNENLKYFREQGDVLLLMQQIIEFLEGNGVITESNQKSKFILYKSFVLFEGCDFIFNKALIKGKEIYIFKGLIYDGINIFSLLGTHDITEKITVTYEDLIIALDEFSESELPKHRKIEITNLLEQINPHIEQARQKWCKKIIRLFLKPKKLEPKYKCWATRIDADGKMIEDLEIPHCFWTSDLSLSYKGEVITKIDSNVGRFINLHIKLNADVPYAQKKKNIHELMEQDYYNLPEATPYNNDYKKYIEFLSQETGLGIRNALAEYRDFLEDKVNDACGWTKPLKRGEKLSTKAKAKNN